MALLEKAIRNNVSGPVVTVVVDISDLYGLVCLPPL